MIQILFDIDMPKSCAECPFMVHCDTCESWENYCPLLHEHVGYDCNEPYTPKDHRRENCPLKEAVERPHGEWDFIGNNLFKCTHCGYIADADYLRKWRVYTFEPEFPTACLKCGADMRKEGEEQ